MANAKGGECCGGKSCAEDIRPQMEVISSCGCRVGTVDRMEGGVLKLTRKDSPDGRHHFVPMSWIDHVDEHVHLNKDADETRRALESDLSGAVT
jgi:hypothetical protein